jgi:Cys-rich repeat protein
VWLVVAAACSTVTVVVQPNEVLEALEVERATPRAAPAPTETAMEPERPDVIAVQAPQSLRPGERFVVRVSTDVLDGELIDRALFVVTDADEYLEIDARGRVSRAVEGEPGRWSVDILGRVKEEPGDVRGSEVTVQVGLTDETGRVGAGQPWTFAVSTAEAVTAQCPEEAACGGRECGADPVCGTSCGTCGVGEACSYAGTCEPESSGGGETETGTSGTETDGATCPGDADCSGRECGADPVCGTSCGTCEAGLTCSFAGRCEMDPGTTGTTGTTDPTTSTSGTTDPTTSTSGTTDPTTSTTGTTDPTTSTSGTTDPTTGTTDPTTGTTGTTDPTTGTTGTTSMPPDMGGVTSPVFDLGGVQDFGGGPAPLGVDCVLDSDCASGVCRSFLGGTVSVCGECRTDAECSAGQVCDPGNARLNDGARCVGSGLGAACSDSGTTCSDGTQCREVHTSFNGQFAVIGCSECALDSDCTPGSVCAPIHDPAVDYAIVGRAYNVCIPQFSRGNGETCRPGSTDTCSSGVCETVELQYPAEATLYGVCGDCLDLSWCSSFQECVPGSAQLGGLYSGSFCQDIPAICGDGVADDFGGNPEECDGADVRGLSCVDVDPNLAGPLGCNPDCTYDLSNCGSP